MNKETLGKCFYFSIDWRGEFKNSFMKLLTQLDFLLKPQSFQDRARSWRGRMSNKMLFSTQKIIDSGTLMELLFETKLFQAAGNVVLILICYNACNFFSQPCFDNHCLQNNYTGG